MTTASQPDTYDVSGEIVVGVDGSEPSLRALEWAIQQGRFTGQRVVAITTWDWPANFGAPIALPSGVNFEKDATAVLRESVEKVCGGDSDVNVDSRVVHGHPALVLTEASTSAALLVVGSRGHGEFAGLLLGSVSSFLTSHSRCPVVVVHYGERG